MKKIKNGCTENFRNISRSVGEKGCSSNKQGYYHWLVLE
ncbi:Uncharacterised protein [Salmonella enterica subsp. salamae]|nr:Uncharacterised protein [Salmonella enterica subsp. salamae]SQI76003.1 Uncharacterised protein [Salmonella enterica subsp. salamae]SQJ46388.1 Uncharacterised protein [Salmonella enterica]